MLNDWQRRQFLQVLTELWYKEITPDIADYLLDSYSNGKMRALKLMESVYKGETEVADALEILKHAPDIGRTSVVSNGLLALPCSTFSCTLE